MTRLQQHTKVTLNDLLYLLYHKIYAEKIAAKMLTENNFIYIRSCSHPLINHIFTLAPANLGGIGSALIVYGSGSSKFIFVLNLLS